jgi:predicted CopG family antitoxin
MKTITLDDTAYLRLKSWKQGHRDSFSSVIKRIVPEKGTVGAMLKFCKENNTSALSGNDELERSVSARAQGDYDPWAQ